ncbi:MAG: glycosyltransferase involved in cell wall biosynthesis [Arenicella sp.]|jgi:glycosyltransferase involved in cell wall biosynthesis
MKYTIVIPAKNEAQGLSSLLPKLLALGAHEIIIVDDGSTDDTCAVCADYNVTVISHPYSKGNGASIKTGARASSTELTVFMDADGQHKPEDVDMLITELQQGGYDMVVGARDADSQAGAFRGIGNKLYNLFSSWVVGRKIPDLTSGFRAVKTSLFMEFLPLLPNGFSYPTTITMSFFRAGYSVGYRTISMPPRIGKSHLRIWKDGGRFLVIIFKVGTLYSPLKIFLPFAAAHFALGILYYSYTFFAFGRFTNMSALLFSSSVIIFLIGLVSEQISTLLYKK